MSKLTQGSQIYFIDPDDDSVITIDCATSFNPGGAPADQLDDTCLEDTGFYKYKRGLRNPGQATIGLRPDPAKASHVRLYELYEETADRDIKFALGWADGTDAPNVDSNGDWDFPSTRTWFSFDGYVADFPFDFQRNALVESQVSVQRSGGGVWTEKSGT